MPEAEQEKDHKVVAWTKDGNKWFWNHVTRDEAMEVYETLKAGKIYEDTSHNGNPGQSILEYIDGSHIYQVKVYRRA